MGPTDRKRFATCLMAAGELYNRKVSEALAGIYWHALEPYDIEAVEQAFRRAMTSPEADSSYFPKPGELVRLIEGGNSVDASMLAWAKFERAVRQVGPYQSVVFDDAIIHRVVYDMGGWSGRFAVATADEWPFIANEFRTRYTGLKRLRVLPEYPRTLVGIAEAENGRHGRAVPPPVLIGEQDKALAVMNGGQEAAGLLQVTRTVGDVLPQLQAPEAA